MEKYIALAKDLKMINAKIISPADIHFDIRGRLKCKWGCDEASSPGNIRCDERGTGYEERVEMVRNYRNILLVHAHDARQVSVAVLEIERAAFLDGYYFAFAVRCCCLCGKCSVETGGTCPSPEKIRPCDQLFGINMFKTARGLGLPINVLKDKNEIQNRYGFVLID